MTILKFTSANGTTHNVEYITNLINPTDENFTVSEIRDMGVSKKESIGLFDKLKEYTIQDFKAFAVTKNLTLKRIPFPTGTIVTLNTAS